jgi:neutral ceramidase
VIRPKTEGKIMHRRQSCVISKGFVTTASLLAVLLGSLVSATAQADSEQPGRFRAACVKVDITPDTPQWLQGYGPRQSTGVHDRIYHRIAILDDGTTAFCLVSTDICTILPSFYRAFCEKLERETPIRCENFWWSTTHTHSAPHVGPQDLARLFAGTLGDRFSIQHDTDYWASVADKLIGGINQAHSQLEPARWGLLPARPLRT